MENNRDFDKTLQPTTVIDLMKLSSGFMAARIILTATELELFDSTTKPSTISDINRKKKLDQRALEGLLDALCGLCILKKTPAGYSNEQIADKYLVTTSPEYYGNLLKHQSRLYADWGHLNDVVAGKAPMHIQSPELKEILNDEKANESFIMGMWSAGRQCADILADKMKQVILGSTVMYDVGGGPGHYAIAFAKLNKKLRAKIIDFPLTLKHARKMVSLANLRERIGFVECDIYNDSDIPVRKESADLALISQVLHIEGYDANLELIKRVHSKLKPGGVLIINENIVDENRTTPATAAIFNVNMLINTERGKTYTLKEVKSLLKFGGFGEIRIFGLLDRFTIIHGRKV